MKLVSIVLATIIGLASQTSAAVYVDQDAAGPLHNGLTWKTAYTSIRDALTKTRSDDIWVKCGVYRERITVGTYRKLYGGFAGTEKSVAARPAYGLPSVIDAQYAGRAVDVPVGARCTIDGFVIRNGSGTRGAGINCGTNSIVYINNCRIESCTAQQQGGGIYFGTYTQGQVTGCVITGNGAPLGGGAVVEYHSYPIFKRCVIANNSASTSGGGVYCPFHSGARLENCTLAFNSAGVSGGAVYAYQGGPVTLVLSILAFNSSLDGGGIFGGGATSATTVTRCCFWENAGGNWGGTIRSLPAISGNSIADPMFVDGPLGDFRLMPESPCSGIGAW